MSSTPTTTAHCNECSGNREHEVLYTTKTQWRNKGTEGERVDGVINFEMLRCSGCQEIKMRRTEINSDDRRYSEKVEPHVTYYPPAVFRREPPWMLTYFAETALGDDEVGYLLLQEIYVALHNDCRTLAAMGVRALIEFLMVRQTGDHGSFGKNLSAFAANGWISDVEKRHIDAALDVGHAAMHRMHVPSLENLATVIDIVEGIVKRIYIDEPRVVRLKQQTPQRKGPFKGR